MPTTRSGRTYSTETREGEQQSEMGTEGENIAALVKMIMEDRQRRDEEDKRREAALAEERVQRAEEAAAEQKRRDAEHQLQMEQLKGQMEILRSITVPAAATPARPLEGDAATGPKDSLKLTKLTDGEDIEAFLKTFERLMEAYEVPKERWAYWLAPQLTGKAQQVYAAVSSDSAKKYDDVKTAILRRYNINEETYRARFRATKRKDGECYTELAIRMSDLLERWTVECKSVAELREKVLLEQLLNVMSPELKIWVTERKPKTTEEAARLADDYMTARRTTTGKNWKERTGGDRDGGDGRSKGGADTRKCHVCKQSGHLAYNCPNKKTQEESASTMKEGESKKGKRNVKCFSCGNMGHMSMQCPDKAWFCGGGIPQQMARRAGQVGKTRVEDIVLDTGCTRTMVRRELVSDDNLLEGEVVAVRCAHGDTVVYPLADVELELEGDKVQVVAAVAEHLPVSVLLGVDVPVLGKLLHKNPSVMHTEGVEEALVVTTRSRARKEKEDEDLRMQKEADSGAEPNPLEPLESGRTDESVVPGAVVEAGDAEDIVREFDFAEEMFLNKTVKEKQTRSQKRVQRCAHGMERAKDQRQQRTEATDVTLETVRAVSEGKSDNVLDGYFQRDGLIFRRWTPPHQGGVTTVDQLVLPVKCRKFVLHTAHTIPSAGHLGKKKTVERILRRFYWPTIYRDAAEFCRSCDICQKSSHRKSTRVPMIPLPIMDEPFSRIAMDIIGPLPRSRAGHRYVLVVCDYATRYPEAVALRTIDAEAVAEELVKIFSRVGIPKEILTDQGSNFTSQLLVEVYRLLHVNAIRTSPYHPQTDGVVERFNQTLKGMLRKTACEEGKDWDRYIPYVLFAYREVPQETTGFSPFELLYGREVRGPLDVLKESWEPSSGSDISVVSHVLQMREKFEKIAEVVQDNSQKAQTRQKAWYDRTARQRKLKEGDQVLVLLPTSSSKLLAQWQGPYPVIKAIGDVNYMIDMYDRRKRRRVFHVNMLKEWHVPNSVSYFSSEEGEGDSGSEDVPLWNDGGGAPVLGKQLSEAQRQELLTLLTTKFSGVMQSTPGKTEVCYHRIDTGDNRPVRLPPYRIPHAYRESVQKEIEELKEQGIIVPSESEWAAPIVLVGKKDGSLRLCVDYRRLNSLSKADAYPMPRIEELIDGLGKAKYLSTLDLAKGYWQVPVAVEDQPKTAFTTPFGLFEFKRMPFGLKGAPATFQRMMDMLLTGLGEYSSAYIDDIIVFSGTWEEHLQHITVILQRLKKAGLTAKPGKCQFGMAECSYLGYRVGNGHVKVERSKVEAVSAFPVPKTKKDVRSFLGLTGYYRKFMPQYATIATPLTDLTRKTGPNCVKWTPECHEAFKKLKELLCSAPVLCAPDFTKEFILQTDASERGVGAVLSQEDEERVDHPVAYFSRKLLPREERYSTIEKECLAIKLAVQAFRVYLLGKPFTIQTDHRALEWLNRVKENNARLTRWSLLMQPFQYNLTYRPGWVNGNADALSRGCPPATNDYL